MSTDDPKGRSGHKPPPPKPVIQDDPLGNDGQWTRIRPVPAAVLRGDRPSLSGSGGSAAPPPEPSDISLSPSELIPASAQSSEPSFTEIKPMAGRPAQAAPKAGEATTILPVPSGAAAPQKGADRTRILSGSPPKAAGQPQDRDRTTVLPVPNAATTLPLVPSLSPIETGGAAARGQSLSDGGSSKATEITPAVKAKPLGRDETVIMSEPSLGSMPTRPGSDSREHTAVRQVFNQFEDSEIRASSITPKTSSQRERSRSSSLTLLLGGLSAVLLGIIGYLVGNAWLRSRELDRLADAARLAVAEAHDKGRLADFVRAEAHTRAWLEAVPADAEALAARALLLNEALYELGGGPELPGGSWEQEAQGAARQVETEHSELALTARVFFALKDGDLPTATALLEELSSLSAGRPASRVRIPAGMPDYLRGVLAVYATEKGAGPGLPGAIGDPLARATRQSPVPLFLRRRAELLSWSGQLPEAQTELATAERKQAEHCGLTIERELTRGRSGSPAAAAAAAAQKILRGFVEPPRGGVDPCGRLDHARAALGAAELLLTSDPSARAEVRGLLAKAAEIAKGGPFEVLYSERLATLAIASGEPVLAESVTRPVFERLPARRRLRLLLAEALLSRGQGGDALSVLSPLLGQSGPSGAEAKKPPADAEALLLGARAQLLLNDTLEAQRLTRQAQAIATTVPERVAAQLLLAQVFLKLQEVASARRTLEPLLRQGALPQELALSVQLLWAQTLIAARPPQQEEARVVLESVIARAPDHVEARLLLGRLLRDRPEHAERAQAEQHLRAALRADERSIPVRRELALLLALRGDYRSARALYTQLVKEEDDADLLLHAALAERLDGAPEQALQTLNRIHRSRSEVTTKYDEALFVERARALLALERPSEVMTLLEAPIGELWQLRRPALPALMIRARVSSSHGSGDPAPLTQARGLLNSLPAASRSDPDVRLAEATLLVAEKQPQQARTVLTALLAAPAASAAAASAAVEDPEVRKLASSLLTSLGGPLAAPPGRGGARPGGKR